MTLTWKHSAAVAALWALRFWWRLKQKGTEMEKDIAVGNAGELKLSLSGSQAVVEFDVKKEVGLVVFESSNKASLPAKDLLKKLLDAAKAASPAGLQPWEQMAEDAILAAFDRLA
jgi:hypothetical protein